MPAVHEGDLQVEASEVGTQEGNPGRVPYAKSTCGFCAMRQLSISCPYFPDNFHYHHTDAGHISQ